MKRILIAVAVLVLLYPVVAWLMGVALERRVDRLADQGQLMVPQLRLIQRTRHGVLTSDEDSSYDLGSTLEFTRHYHRGWYASVDDVTIEVSGAALDAVPLIRPAVAATLGAAGSGTAGSGTAAQGPPTSGAAGPLLRLSIRSVIHHGPVCGLTCFALAGAETHVSFPNPLQASLARLFAGKEPLTIMSRFGFFGGGSAALTSPAFEHAEVGQDSRLSWGGLDATTRYGAGQDWYGIAAAAPSLHFDGAKGTLAIEGMSLDVHSKRLLRTLYGGDSRWEMKHLRATGTDQTRQFTVDDLEFAGQIHAQDRFLNASYRFGAGPILTPPLSLSSAHLDLTWKHLGLETLESLVAAVRAAGQQNAALAAAARTQRMMAALKQPLEALLLEQPELDIDRVSAATAQGQGLVTGVIRFADLNAADFGAPAMLLRKLDVRLDVAIDEAFLSSLPGPGANALAQLQPMIDQGYFTRSAGALRTQILFRGGQPTLNGKPFNPAAMRPAVPPAAPR